MKIKSILLTLLVWSVIATFFVISRNVNGTVDATSKTFQTIDTDQIIPKSAINKLQAATATNPTNPELIPDRIAYMMVFRLLSSHRNESDRKRLRPYIKQILGITNNNDIEEVFRLADDFKRLTLPIDSQINSIKERYHPAHSPFNNDDRQELNKLKKDKEKIVDDLMDDIPRRLTANGKNKLHRNIQERVKQKIKVKD